jgi:hypothetical protein
MERYREFREKKPDTNLIQNLGRQTRSGVKAGADAYQATPSDRER